MRLNTYTGFFAHRISKLLAVLVLAVVLLLQVDGFARNMRQGSSLHLPLQPVYVADTPVVLSLCNLTDSIDISSYLGANDTTTDDTLVWWVLQPAAIGTLVATDTLAANGGLILPSGFIYRFTAAEVGHDSCTVVVTNHEGNDTILFHFLLVAPPVAGSITGTKTVICYGDTLHLADSVNGGEWLVSGPGASIVAGLFTGNIAGADTAFYVVTNLCGNDTARYPVVVNGPPDAGVISGASICRGDAKTFTDTVTGGVWSVADTNASVDSNGTVHAIVPGADTVFYSVSGTCGTGIAYYAMTIDTPVHLKKIVGTLRVCVGGTDTLYETVYGGTWGASSPSLLVTGLDTQSVITGVKPGLDTVVYLLVNGCGFFDTTCVVRIDTLPVVYPIQLADSVCVDYSTQATDTIKPTLGAVTWYSLDTFAQVSSAGYVHGVSMGIDTVVFVCHNSCGADTAYKTIKVDPLPFAGYILGPDTICLGQTTVFTDSGANGIGYFNAGVMASDSVATNYTASVFGLQTVVYTVSNNCGSKISSHYIQVLEPPSGLVTSGPRSLCLGDSVVYKNSEKGGYWFVSGSDATVNMFTGMTTAISPGMDTIIYILTNSCGADTDRFAMTVNPQPEIPLLSRFENLLSVDSGLASYQWTLNGISIPGATSDTYTVATPGVYEVIIGNSAGCKLVTSFNDVTDLVPCTTSDLHVYPNPVVSTLYLHWCNYLNVQIYDMMGRSVFVGYHITQADLSGFTPAPYLLYLVDDFGRKVNARIIVKD